MVESQIERQPEEVVDWCACPLSPYLFSGRGPKSPGREQNAQQIGVNRLATSILNARFIVWRQTPARYNWPLIRVRQKVNSSLGQVHPPLLRLDPPSTKPFFLLRSRLVRLNPSSATIAPFLFLLTASRSSCLRYSS